MERFIAIKNGEMNNYDNKWAKIAATLRYFFFFADLAALCSGRRVNRVAGSWGGGGRSEMLGLGEVFFIHLYICICVCL